MLSGLCRKSLLFSKWFRIAFSVTLLGVFILFHWAYVPKVKVRNKHIFMMQDSKDKFNNASILKFQDYVNETLQNNFMVTNREIKQNKVDSSEINILITLMNTNSNPTILAKFTTAVSSILTRSTTPLAIYIIGDKDSQLKGEQIVLKIKDSDVIRVIKIDIDKILNVTADVVKDMQTHFSYSTGSYYGQSLFFLSIAVHKVTSLKLEKAIFIDCDVKFNADIKDLYAHFEKFTRNNIIGIAHENQPVYRHTFSYYRSLNPGTRVGDPPPYGLTGFNSGILLLDIRKMQASSLYNSLLNINTLEHMTKKYFFKGHLGDQDFFTLLSMEYEDLFYELPCAWNRQLCVWWRDKGYEDVFDLYFKCDEKINVYHGNCNTPIPV